MENNKIKLGQFIDSGNNLIVAESPLDAYTTAILQMKRDIKSKKVCFGTVVGIVETENRDNIIVIVKCNNLSVHIPVEDFCAFTKMDETSSPNGLDMLYRYRQRCDRMHGASVSFIPLVMAYDENEVPYFIGSRKAAMEAQQKVYFFGENPQVQVGSVANASIIATDPRYITVEWLGVETTIGVGKLSAYTYIEDVRNEYKVGEGIRVAVESFELDEENERVLDISLSHALVEKAEGTVSPVGDWMLGGRFSATVAACLEKYYIVILSTNKSRGIVPVEQYIGSDVLSKGDKVAMLVTGIDKERNLVIGKCRRTE